ncbi:MAG: type VI secretion IcmF C-terminal domain-containing protein [Caenibius sp.]
MQLEVPYLFTRAGYEKAYQVGLATVVSDIKKDMWVLGGDAGTFGIQSQMSQIRPSVASLYARDYIAAWEKVATTPRPADYFGDPAARGAFTKSPSPLKLLLLELRKNTTFTGGSAGAKDIAREAISQSRYGRYAGAAEKVGTGGGFDAGAEISNYFQSLHSFVGDGKTPGPIDELANAIRQAGSNVESARLTGGGVGSDSVQSSMAMSMGSVVSAAGGAPPQLQGFVSSVANGGTAATVSSAQGAISDAYTKSVLPECQLATQDKYPFVGTASSDASLVDVQQVFGMGGSFDSFLQQRALPLLDMSGPIWRWSTENPVTADMNPASPDEFRKARQLRDMLVGGMSVKFEVKAFGAGVDEVRLRVGGTDYTFESGSSGGQRPVIWSPQGLVPQAMVEMFSDGQSVEQISAAGPWALFRLMDEARRENAGPQSILATFGRGAKNVAFKVSLPGTQNPFGRGGVWSFRCPVAL